MWSSVLFEAPVKHSLFNRCWGTYFGMIFVVSRGKEYDPLTHTTNFLLINGLVDVVKWYGFVWDLTKCSRI